MRSTVSTPRTRSAGWVLALALLFTPGLGSDSSKAAFADLDAAIARGVSTGVYPGAVVIVGRGNTTLHVRSFGRISWAAGARTPSPDSTLYDLASLTKVVATTSAALILVDRGTLDLTAPVSRYLPRFDQPSQRAITVRMLLDHTSGLKPYVEFYKKSSSPQGMANLILREEPLRTPGELAVYSDINALLLGMIIESVTGESLDQFSRREVFDPLKMTETGFNPSVRRQRRAAPSYSDRQHHIAGLVHDRNARDLGGVAGHAGLFSTGMDLARFAQWWLQEGRVSDRQLASPETMRQFLQRRGSSGTRLLGWDSPDLSVAGGSVFGNRLSPAAYGHTGWTGTQLWIDPEKDLFVVLLTNRSLNPNTARSLRNLRMVRAQVANAAVEGAYIACQSQQSTC